MFLNNFSSATSGLTVNVNNAAQMNATLGGKVLNLTGANINLNNSGTIDPALLGLVSILSGGAFIGSGATSAVSVVNNGSGIIRGTGMLLGPNLTSIDGLALAVNNAVAGTTTITNDGTITSTGLSVGGITLADTPVVGVYGGSQVNMTNNASGTINGRVAFETSVAGNSFTNAGNITGSVSMGAGSTNTFYAITGSSVNPGDGVQTTVGLGGMIGINLTFAPTGTIDGGAAGTNTLILQNPIGLGGGTTGTGTASSAVYVNFNNLTLNSGTWTLQGPLVSGATTLNGGVAQFNDNAAFGSGVLTSNGGIIQASNAGLALANQINLGAGGLTVQGINGMTLNGVISGTGGLTKIGSGQINLNGINTYTGNTVLNGGVVLLGNNQAFSTGSITVGGSTSLSTPGPISLSNAINLNSTMTATGTGALTLGGVIRGASNLTKTGSGSLTLNGINTYSGITSLSAGTLRVGNNNALGTGVLNTSNGSSLDSTGNVTLANNVGITGALNMLGSNALTLSGIVSGTGAITKSGSANLTLTGNNTNSGTTALNGGTLFVGSNTALGTGALNAANGTTLDATTAVTLANAVALAGGLTLGGTQALGLSGVISSTGNLIKNGTANLTLSGNNTFSGGTALNNGTLIVGSNTALGTGALTTAAGTTLDSSTTVALTNAVALGGNLTVNGTNTFSGGTTLNAGTLTLGSAGALGNGGLTVGGASTLDTSTGMSVGNNITLNAGLTLAGSNTLNLSGVIDGAGSLTKDGFGDLTLSGNNTFTGALNIAAGSLTTASSGALGNTSGANISAGASLYLNSSASLDGLSGSGSVQIAGGNLLTVGGVSNTSTFDGDLGGSGGLTKIGSGTLNLTGSSGLTGNTNVNGGTLNLTGSLASTQLKINNGATLTGTGSALGLITINSGGHLALSSGNTLSTSSLILTANSNVDASLATPSTTSLMNIGGNLTLDGNLNVTDAGGFGVGVYRLFNYIGALTDNGLTVAGVPVGYGLGDILVQTLGNQVNLIVSAPNTNLRFWDGSQTIPNGTVDGGSGTWNAGGTNWTNSNGTLNQTWAGDFAVFQGTAGTVSVNGTQLFTGMQFLTDGYNVVNGTSGLLTAVNGTGGTTAVRVDPGVTATASVDINGSGILNKLDSGTLVLNGANSYSGGTQLDGGTLVVGSNTALGTGALIANAGTQLDSNAAVTLANTTTLNGNLTVVGSNDLTLNGVIGGTGGLIKTGAANLTLGGNNAFLGPVALNAGGLILASNSALGSATLNAANGTTLDANTTVAVNNAVNLAGNLGIGGSADLTLVGTVNGAGSLIKNGAANLTLSGNNNFLGGITLNAGTLTVGSNGALGLGNLTVAGASALDSNTSASLGNNVVLNANLTNTGNSDVALSGVVSGTGGLIKNGASNLTLNGINTYSGGTTLNAGTVTLGTSSGLGSGAVTVASASTLDTSAPLVLANNVNVNANLSVAGNNNLTLGGVIAGAGTLTKNGLADLTLSGNNTFSGMFDVESGSLTTLGNSALGSNAGVNLGAAASLNLGGSGSLASLTGSGTALIGGGNALSIGDNNANSIFDGVLTGTGELSKLGTGTLTLTGINSLTGNTTVNAGTLNVNGSLDSASVLVNSGGILTGSGSLGGAVTVADGGHLAGATGSTLSVNSLVFNGNSNFDVGLGAPVSGGGNALVNVGGNLTLDGTLNVSNIGGFGSGVYRLINYTGGLTDNGMLFGTLPGSVTSGDLTLQTALSNQVNLLVTVPGVTVQFWDGNQLGQNGSVEGGSGIWGIGNTNWTDVNGRTNQAWSNNFAVFQGAAGTVTVNGAQSITGMQFVTDGYSLVNGTAGSLNLVNGSLGNATVRVDPNATAIIGVALNGAGTLGKYDTGTLVLNATNGYTGGTVLNGGKLVVGNNVALGTGVVTAANGTALDSNTAASLSNAIVLNGGMTIGGSNALTLGGMVSGIGSLIKTGASSLTLNGNNTYSGGTQLNDGTLILGNNGAISSGALNVTGQSNLDSTSALQLVNAVNLGSQLTLAGNQNTSLIGAITGNGSLVKNGNGSLMLGGANNYSGGTTLNGGSTIGDTSSLQGAIVNNAALTFAQNADGIYTGNLTGSGTLHKTGTGQLLLSGNNTFTGNTLVQDGSLFVNGLFNSANVNVASGAKIGGSGQLGGAVQLDNGATLVGGGTAIPLSVGSLKLSSGTNLDFSLGLVSSFTPVVNIAGNLILDGTLNISNAGDFGAGVYQLFRYGGNLTDNGLVYGSLPISADNLTLQTSIANQVNLLVQGKFGQLQFWNGGTSNPNGSIGGGSGTWGPDTDWTDSTGTQVLSSTNPFAIFGGEGGIVTVEGKQDFTGLQFLDNGYTLVAGADGSLSPMNTADGSLAVIRVNTDITAQIDAPLVGQGGISKLDTGILVLNGANTFTGGVNLKQGRINLGNSAALGTGVLSMDDGTAIGFTQNGLTIANNLYMTGSNDPEIDTGTNQATWSGAISGAGFLTKKGTGTLILTNQHNTYTGVTDVAEGTLQAGASNSLSATSAHQVKAGAKLDLAGHNQSLASLNNSGVVNLSGSTPGTILKITGAYVGNTGQLGLSTVFGNDQSATDQLLLSGVNAIASGHSTLNITNVGGLGAQTIGNGIEVIKTEGGARIDTDAFSLAGGHIDVGAYEYRLFQNGQSVALKSSTNSIEPEPKPEIVTYRQEVPLMSALATQLRQGDITMLGDMRKRIGDNALENSSSDQEDYKVWTRYLHIEPTIKQQGTVRPESDGKQTGFQLGVDVFANDQIKAGFYVGQLDGKMHVNGFASGKENQYVGWNSLRNRYLGAYANWYDKSGLYAEAVLQGADYRSNLHTAENNKGAVTDGKSWIASLEVGKAFELTSHWKIEPQAQFIYRDMSLKDTELQFSNVENKADDDWMLRLGARIKGEYQMRLGSVQPYTRINYYQSGDTTDVTRFIVPAATTDIQTKGGYRATELAIGGAVQLNSNVGIYTELGQVWNNSGDSEVKNDVQASLGMQMRW
ncbi:autotransporter-associated beta strand repeat-containing protein [Acinetobacter silvestris]|uniref:autotransporter-associated beta strand repeat-containing protein n=1 Tax=Acinetobacter silvestris TaxID=1977882 RepID=UPI0020750998|nr:autotransporter-associated beta strand repeat-containing protein [Acinetobacter silvestris]